jgi:hypothetical protein
VTLPPVFVLGVRRSGTTLLRVILDRSPGLAIPDETFFVPQIAHRHPTPVDPDELLEDLRRVPRIATWGVPVDELAARLKPGMTTGEALDAVFLSYAAKHGKPRWGDKTPLYMRHLDLIDGLFPEARYVHLIRDGRDTTLAFLDMPGGVAARTWAHPRSAAAFACEWRTQVQAARLLGRRVGPSRFLEVRYEELVADSAAAVQRVCEFARIPFEPAMLEYAGAVDVSRKPHLQRLLEPPRTGVRDWRSQMSSEDVEAFEEVAGDLLAELGYEPSRPQRSEPSARARLRLARYRAAVGAWNALAYATERSPLWRRRHPRLI